MDVQQQQQQRQPAAAAPRLLGPATDPMRFGRPQFDLAVRQPEILAYIPEEDCFGSFYNVLVRNDASVKYAYAPIVGKAKSEARTGHVEYCNVLQRKRTQDSNDLEFELTPRVVAVKVFFQHKMDDMRARNGMEDTFKEVAVMQELGQIPHVSTCEEALYVESNQTYCIVMPFYKDGDIYDLLQKTDEHGSNRVSEDQARSIFRDIMLGLLALHEKGVCHHDISIENVMIDEGRAYIIDMGMALKYNRRCLVAPQAAYGKNPYMSPEIYRSRLPFDAEAIDVWSAGCVLFCMLTGNDSYKVPLREDVKFLYMTRYLQDLFDQWDVNISNECVELLRMILQVRPDRRYSIDEILRHRWMQ